MFAIMNMLTGFSAHLDDVVQKPCKTAETHCERSRHCFEGFSPTRESFTSYVIWGLRLICYFLVYYVKRLCDSLL